jgi:uridylate kinase
MPIMVFDMNKPGNIMRMAMGETIGTVIRESQEQLTTI